MYVSVCVCRCITVCHEFPWQDLIISLPTPWKLNEPFGEKKTQRCKTQRKRQTDRQTDRFRSWAEWSTDRQLFTRWLSVNILPAEAFWLTAPKSQWMPYWTFSRRSMRMVDKTGGQHYYRRRLNYPLLVILYITQLYIIIIIITRNYLRLRSRMVLSVFHKPWSGHLYPLQTNVMMLNCNFKAALTHLANLGVCLQPVLHWTYTVITELVMMAKKNYKNKIVTNMRQNNRQIKQIPF